MSTKKIGVALFAGIFALALAGCASTGDRDAAVPQQAAAAQPCKGTEPTTGSSIRRRDCGNSPVQTVNADNLREYKREAGTR
ncbi:hypothetical protein [Rugamonas aquatica]|uniref:Lipoprotein n=1 Tax=Rugamonas aquatica TaxID=2743357 RepID=A0A6A7NBD9_9BURK|nr:hypothetical protein [Rugamonas aquatica]MQA42489.1 hypothetical protein [Rugamonas aquatica]